MLKNEFFTKMFTNHFAERFFIRVVVWYLIFTLTLFEREMGGIYGEWGFEKHNMGLQAVNTQAHSVFPDDSIILKFWFYSYFKLILTVLSFISTLLDPWK